MTKDQLWKIFCDKNPKFLDEKASITFTGKGLKQFFDQTYDQAVKATSKTNDFMSKLFK